MTRRRPPPAKAQPLKVTCACPLAQWGSHLSACAAERAKREPTRDEVATAVEAPARPGGTP